MFTQFGSGLTTKHLISMNQLPDHNSRFYAVYDMSFVDICRITLEIRNNIIDHVQSLIGQTNKNILFLLGDTGSGKSTIFCFLRGDQMVTNGHNYETVDQSTHSG